MSNIDDTILATLIRLEASIADLKSNTAMRIDRLEGGREEIFRADLIALRTDFAAHIDRLAVHLTDVRSDVAFKSGSTDEVTRANEDTRRMVYNLEDIVMTTVKQLRSLRDRVGKIEDGLQSGTGV